MQYLPLTTIPGENVAQREAREGRNAASSFGEISSFLQKQGALQKEEGKELNPMQQWKIRNDAMMLSGNPLLQKQAQKEQETYATQMMQAQFRDERTSDLKNFLATQDPRYGGFAQYLKDKRIPMYEAEGDKALSSSDLIKWKIPDGKGGWTTPGPGTTMNMLQEIGGVPMTTDEQKAEQKATKATEITGTMQEMLFGPDGIFTSGFGAEPGVWNKIKDTAKANYEYFTQNDPRFKQYQEYSMGLLSSLAKSIGDEAGALAEGDVHRAGALIPRLYGPFVDSPEVARRKLAALNRLIEVGRKRELTSKDVDYALAGFSEKELGAASEPVLDEGFRWAED